MSLNLQHFKANTIVSDYGFKSLQTESSHQSGWKKTVFETYEDASVPDKWTSTLIEECKKAKIEFFSSPYDFNSVDMLNKHGVAAHKIGSGDITWIEIIEYIAKSKVPVFIATGAADILDVKRAMNILIKEKAQICLMQCNTNYTGSEDNFRYINLKSPKYLQKALSGCRSWFVRSYPGHSTVLGAVSLGARVIEKHFTDDNTREGPDHLFSLNPKAWRDMVNATRELENSLGVEEKKLRITKKIQLFCNEEL